MNTPCVPVGDTTAGVRVTSSIDDTSGYREIGGDILCKPVSREERSEDEEEYDNDAYYTDGFVKKRQLNMNVAHYTTPADDDSDGECRANGSAYSSDICEDSFDEAETKST